MFDDYCDDMDGFVYGLDVEEDLSPASEVLGSGSVGHVSVWRYYYVVYADSNNRIHGGTYFGKSIKGVARYVLDSDDDRKILFIHDFRTRETKCFLEKEN